MINGVVGLLLIRADREHRSVTLTADGKHPLTDEWTSAGVIVGVLLAAATGWERLDPVVAAAVGLNILFTGFRLVAGAASSLMDAALPTEDVARVSTALAGLRSVEVDFTDVRTRGSGRHGFVTLTVLVPGGWSVTRGHDLTELVEDTIGAALPGAHVQAHVEPAAPSTLLTGPSPTPGEGTATRADRDGSTTE